METGGFLFISPLFDLVYNSLIVLYRALGGDLGLALIAIAIISRLLVLPFTLKQLKNVDKNKEFQKKYEEIKSKFKSNKEKQTQELAKLQSQYLPGQLSGCLTLILQLLLLIQINYVIRGLLKYGAEGFNTVAYSFVDKFPLDYQFDLTFLGNLLNLGESAKDQGLTNFEKSWPYLVLAGILVFSQYFSMKILSGLTKPPEPEKKAKSEKQKDKNKKKDEEPSFSEVFQNTNQQMALFFPLLLGFFSLNYPSGLSLYFATTSLFVIIQQMVMKRKTIFAKLKGEGETQDPAAQGKKKQKKKRRKRKVKK